MTVLTQGRGPLAAHETLRPWGCARAAQTLTRPRVRAVLDRFTGVVLIAIGLRLAAEHR
jgi:threonine/homoserine/homoserine lactone efflux protein